MGRKENLESLQTVFSEVFGRTVELNENMVQDEIEDWDSLNNIRLLTTLEEHFKIQLNTQDVLQINSIKSILNILDSKQV